VTDFTYCAVVSQTYGTTCMNPLVITSEESGIC